MLYVSHSQAISLQIGPCYCCPRPGMLCRFGQAVQAVLMHAALRAPQLRCEALESMLLWLTKLWQKPTGPYHVSAVPKTSWRNLLLHATDDKGTVSVSYAYVL